MTRHERRQLQREGAIRLLAAYATPDGAVFGVPGPAMLCKFGPFHGGSDVVVAVFGRGCDTVVYLTADTLRAAGDKIQAGDAPSMDKADDRQLDAIARGVQAHAGWPERAATIAQALRPRSLLARSRRKQAAAFKASILDILS